MSQGDPLKNYRITEHPILEFKRGKKKTFTYNGELVEGYENESVLAALYAAGIRVFSKSKVLGNPRGAFCMIGKCSSCLMEVDGVSNVRICTIPVKDVKNVKSQSGLANPPATSSFPGNRPANINVDVLIVGGGPAGLFAAIHAGKYGTNVLIVDDHYFLGGQLVKQTHKFFGSKDLFSGIRGFEIAKKLVNEIEQNSNVQAVTQTTVFGIYDGLTVGAYDHKNRRLLKIKAKQVIVATGASENYLVFENNDLPGVMGAGAAQTLMNVYGVKPGERALIVGAGNVGLIVAYQLMQAGVDVIAIVEAMPRIGGYFVHAAKLRRYGVPIYTSHTIKKAHGKNYVEGATIIAINSRFNEIPGSEKYFEVDLICLAVGLNPYSQLLAQAGCRMAYIPELGGLVPLRNKYQETTVGGLLVAGDVSGIEEASTAMLEGGIAGITAIINIRGKKLKDAFMDREKMLVKLEEIRSGPVFERIRKGLEKVIVSG